MAVTGWAWAAAVGVVAGLLAALAIEDVSRLRADSERLRVVEQELECERERRRTECELARQQVALARRETAVTGVWSKVWGGAYNEAVSTGRIVPVSALLARADVEMKAENLHLPLDGGAASRDTAAAG